MNATNSFQFHSFGQSHGHSFWVDVLIFIAVAVALYVVFKLVALMLSKANLTQRR